MRGELLCAALAAAPVMACEPSVKGTITVNSKAFEVATCHSGQANVPAFDGIDFLDSQGRRVRFVRRAEGTTRAYLFEPGQKSGTLIGDGCAMLKLAPEHSAINSVRNLQGTVVGQCSRDGQSLSVQLTFQDCH